MGVRGFQWLNPRVCEPPHRVTHPEKFDRLVASLAANGWRRDCPVLLGYEAEDDGVVYLVSGSHRHAAAAALQQPIPVWVYTAEEIDTHWGHESWVQLIAHPPLLGEVDPGGEGDTRV